MHAVGSTFPRLPSPDSADVSLSTTFMPIELKTIPATHAYILRSRTDLRMMSFVGMVHLMGSGAV